MKQKKISLVVTVTWHESFKCQYKMLFMTSWKIDDIANENIKKKNNQYLLTTVWASNNNDLKMFKWILI